MSMTIMVTSLKGGVGKTTFASALAFTAARGSQRTVCVDMDFGSGGLDIALGAENSLGANIIDVFRGRAAPDKALICCGSLPELTLISSPMTVFGTHPDVTPAQIDAALAELRKISDLVILDMPAGGGEFFSVLAASSQIDLIVVVTTDTPTSVRSAEKCGIELARLSKKPVKLVINCYDVHRPKKNGAGLVELVGNVAVPALGVIPFDPAVRSALIEGRPVTAVAKSDAARAVMNIHSRLCGENVPLLSGIIGSGRRKKLF